MIFEELNVSNDNFSKFYFSRVYLKNGAEFSNVRGVYITDKIVVLATKISGNVANQLVICRNEIAAVEHGEVHFNKCVYG
jgi:hypothetical protein